MISVEKTVISPIEWFWHSDGKSSHHLYENSSGGSLSLGQYYNILIIVSFLEVSAVPRAWPREEAISPVPFSECCPAAVSWARGNLRLVCLWATLSSRRYQVWKCPHERRKLFQLMASIDVFYIIKPTPVIIPWTWTQREWDSLLQVFFFFSNFQCTPWHLVKMQILTQQVWRVLELHIAYKLPEDAGVDAAGSGTPHRTAKCGPSQAVLVSLSCPSGLPLIPFLMQSSNIY